MELSNDELLAYGLNQNKLTNLELELLLRLEQNIDAREYVVTGIMHGPCAACVYLQNILPPPELSGEQHVAKDETQWQ